MAELLRDHLNIPLNDLWSTQELIIRDKIMLDLSNYFLLPVNLVFVKDSPMADTKDHPIAQANRARIAGFIEEVVLLFGFQFHVVSQQFPSCVFDSQSVPTYIIRHQDMQLLNLLV